VWPLPVERRGVLPDVRPPLRFREVEWEEREEVEVEWVDEPDRMRPVVRFVAAMQTSSEWCGIRRRSGIEARIGKQGTFPGRPRIRVVANARWTRASRRKGCEQEGEREALL